MEIDNHSESRNESSPATMQQNPFASLDAQDAVCKNLSDLGRIRLTPIRQNTILGPRSCVLDAGISIYMNNPGFVYVVDSSAVRKVDLKDIHRVPITDKYWCLVDSNTNLVTVHTHIYKLGYFILQSASPRNQRIEWWTKYRRPLRTFFMKE